jgi:hypothetical protein
MHRFHQMPRARRKQFLNASSLATLAIPILAGIISATVTRAQPQIQIAGASAPEFTFQAQSQSQDKSAKRPALEYDVASIKRFIPGSGRTNMTGRIGFSETPDGLTAR